VWKEVRPAYDAYLSLFPQNWVIRSQYAARAAKAGDWKAADAQMKVLGVQPHPRVFPDAKEYTRLRQEAAEKAAVSGG